jgi:hypothetical protein
MSKFKAQMNVKCQNLKYFDFGIYVFHLLFACLPRPRSGPGPVGRNFEIWN